MRFHTWLMKRRGEDSPIGDLANDAHDDKDWPKNAKKYHEYHARLTRAGASSEAKRTFNEAWEEYSGKKVEPDDWEKPYLKLLKLVLRPERKKMTPTLRMDVLERDDFRCQLCGRTAQDDDVKVEVDHVIPVTKGGKTEMSNLWTLCFECNRGKGTRELGAA